MPIESVRVAACQLPEIREHIDKALEWIATYATRAETEGARLLCFPECFLQGYLTDEADARRHALSLRSARFASILEGLERFTATLVIGLIEADGDRVFNAAAVVRRGQLIGVYRKVHLLEGEKRAFSAGETYPVFDAEGLKFGINICFDTNFVDAPSAVAAQGARLIACPSNNMMRCETALQWKDRHNEIRAERTKEAGLWLISSDVTGEREGRIGFGPTAVIDPHGCIVGQVPTGEVGMVVADIPLS